MFTSAYAGIFWNRLLKTDLNQLFLSLSNWFEALSSINHFLRLWALNFALSLSISNQSLFEALGLEFSITTLGSFPASDLWYYEYCFDYFPLEHFKGWQTELLFIAFHCLTVVTSLQGVKRAFPYVASDEAEELVEIQTPMLFKLVRSKALDNI